VLTTGAALWGVILMVALPHGLGSLLLRGDNWHDAYSLVPWLVLSMMGATTMAGANAGLRALAASKLSMRVTLIQAAAYIVLGVVGALLWGAVGSVAGTAVATWFGAVLCWLQLRKALHQHQESQQGTADGTVLPINRGPRTAED
jgi:Na+-driven multidrug efflux pump